MKNAVLVTCAFLLPSMASAQKSTGDAAVCDRLAASLKLTNAKVTAAPAVTTGGFTPPAAPGGEAPKPIADLPAFCRVELTLTPSSDSDIKSEAWLPLAGWNGRFQEVGNGAWAGSIQYGALADRLKRGYAAASTDAGHTGTDASFAMGHAEKLKNFGYPPGHETAVPSKPALTDFYGTGAAEVEAARKIYAGVKNPKTGELIFPGLEPGSELNWGGPAGGPEPLAVSADLFKYVVFKDPKWDFRKFDLARDYDAVHRIDSLDLSPTSPDIKAFVARGGKLLIYQGWGDMNVAPKSTVDYYENVVKTIGQKQVDDSVRLFFAPGMAHCGGGDGPNVFDALGPLEEWREHGKAPASIVATHWTYGKLDRSRPLCPYPQVAKYIGGGGGDNTDAAYFVCGAPNGNHGTGAK